MDTITNMNKLPALLAIVLMAFHISASASSEEETLTRLLNEFLSGASANEISAHERFWDDDLVYTSSSGLRFGKADILEGMRSEDQDSSAEPATVYSAEDIRIRLYGDSAVVAFRLVGRKQGVSPGVTEYFNTGTFVKRGGEWKVVAWQATVIPETES